MTQAIDSEHCDRLRSVLDRQFDRFGGIQSIERLSSGASLETYRLTVTIGGASRQLALRRAIKGVPKAAIPWAPSIEAEAQLMTAARAAGIPSPEVYYVFREDDGLGHGFLMQWLEGETLGSRIVRLDKLAGVRGKLAYQCGEILGRIHSVDVSRTKLDAVLHRLSPQQLLQYTIDRYREFDVARPMLEYAACWLTRNLPPAADFTLVHNDFRNGNFVVAEAGIVAVLDWEHALIGDPMRDLGWLCVNSWRYGRSDLPVGGFGSYEELFAGYAAVTGRRVDRSAVKYWEVFGALWWAVGCLQLAAQYRDGLDSSIERLAIGRRVSECEADCVNLLIPGPLGVAAEAQSPAPAPPETLELLDGVARFLQTDIAASQQDRTGYLARVAANTLEIVRRDLNAGGLARAREEASLRSLLGRTGTLDELRRALVYMVREDPGALDDRQLIQHLRDTTAAQIAIDQPKYSGLRTMLGRG